MLAIKDTEKCDTVEFRGRLGRMFSGCKRGDVCDSVLKKHENFNLLITWEQFLWQVMLLP